MLSNRTRETMPKSSLIFLVFYIFFVTQCECDYKHIGDFLIAMWKKDATTYIPKHVAPKWEYEQRTVKKNYTSSRDNGQTSMFYVIKKGRPRIYGQNGYRKPSVRRNSRFQYVYAAMKKCIYTPEYDTDVDKYVFQVRKNKFLRMLAKSDFQIARLEERTRENRESELCWRKRRHLLTASNFGKVCRRKNYTSCVKLVDRILYNVFFDSPSLKYGRKHEALAIDELREKGIHIKQCGVFVDREFPYLAATPDGLIDKDGLVEIKCPSTAEYKTPIQAILDPGSGVSTFWRKGNETLLDINKKHYYYFQIQGQLRITRRKYCLFVVWTPRGMHTETILRDDNFWLTNMQDKLIKFYINCILPEIVDPRKIRKLPIRDPPYIQKAISLYVKKKMELRKKRNKNLKLF